MNQGRHITQLCIFIASTCSVAQILPHKLHEDQTREALTAIRAGYEIIISS